MILPAVFALSLAIGLAAAVLASRLPPRAWAAFALTLLPPLGLYYLLASC